MDGKPNPPDSVTSFAGATCGEPLGAGRGVTAGAVFGSFRNRCAGLMRSSRPGFSSGDATARPAPDGVCGADWEASTLDGAGDDETSSAGLKTGSEDTFTTSTFPVDGGSGAALAMLVAGAGFGIGKVRVTVFVRGFGGFAGGVAVAITAFVMAGRAGMRSSSSSRARARTGSRFGGGGFNAR